MKKTTLCAALVLAAACFTACNTKKAKEADQQAQNTEQLAQTAETVASQADTDALTQLFEANKDKYPLTDLNLLDNPLFQERVKPLLGDKRYAELKNLTVETPITLEDDGNTYAISLSEPHNVPANNVKVKYSKTTGKFSIDNTVNSKTNTVSE